MGCCAELTGIVVSVFTDRTVQTEYCDLKWNDVAKLDYLGKDERLVHDRFIPERSKEMISAMKLMIGF